MNSDWCTTSQSLHISSSIFWTWQAFIYQFSVKLWNQVHPEPVGSWGVMRGVTQNQRKVYWQCSVWSHDFLLAGRKPLVFRSLWQFTAKSFSPYLKQRSKMSYSRSPCGYSFLAPVFLSKLCRSVVRYMHHLPAALLYACSRTGTGQLAGE